MMSRKLLCLFAVSVAVALCTPPLATAKAPSKEGAEFKEKIDRQVNPLLEGKAIVGGMVGIIRDGERSYFSYGETTKESGKSPNKRTIYEIGSISKAFTGTLLADAVLQNQVSLDDPLQKYLPETVKVPSKGESPITLKHLATHTSGLPRLPDNLAPKNPSDPYASYTGESAYTFLNAHKLSRAPGEKSEYSNFGMGLLGHVLSQQADKSYEELLIERICKPLKMSSTSVELSRARKRRLAPPYRGDLQPDHNWHFDSLTGAGGIRSTAADMLTFAEAALTPGDKAVHQALTKSMEPIKLGGATMGLGWQIAGDGVTRWHNGRTGGYSSALYIHRPSKTAVVLLTNTSAEKTTAVTEKLIQTVLGMTVEPISMKQEIDVDPEILARYVGDYPLTPAFVLTVSLKDNQLMIQATGQPKLPVYASSEKEFFYKVVEARVVFDVNEEGKATGLTLHQAGMKLPGKRIK